MRNGAGASLGGRIALVLLTLYALAMIAPDLIRIVRPLGSFGITTNNDGLIYDVQSPFASEEDSPAWRAGVREGDRLDLAAMRCVPVDTILSSTMLSQWGGVNYVMPGRKGAFILAADGGRPARKIMLTAQPRPVSRLLQFVLALEQIAGILVVLGAAYLVWLRPGPMTWGFFVYVILFNPGQAFQFYAWLQQWPAALMAQDVASCILQAAGYAGLLLFALRAPIDRTEGRWRLIERALPVLAVAFLALSLSTLGSVFGYRAEIAMRASALLGFAVGLAAIAILIGRRRDLSPQDYQRIRWVIWGCLIGLPAYLIAELSMETSLLVRFFEGGPSEEVAGLLYMINGVLCLFVVEALRRPTVINVAIPLRRGTVLGLLLSVPVFFIHEELNVLNELTGLPDWAWVMLASVIVYAIARAHEFTTELADRLFDREFLRAERRLAEVGAALERASSLAEIERLLVEEPIELLELASAALFRAENGLLRRRMSRGWRAGDAETLTGAEPMLAAKTDRGPFGLKSAGDAGRNPPLPDGVARPLLGVPVGNARRRFALTLYSGHEAGTDLDGKERKLLDGLARDAEHAYAQVESETLQRRIAELEGRLARVSTTG